MNHTGDSAALRSWLLARSHRRLSLLFFGSTTLFFFFGLSLAVAMELELLTPPGDVFSPETYACLFTLHGLAMVFLFLLPAIFGVLGNAAVARLPAKSEVRAGSAGILAWYLHLSGGLVLVWVFASGGVGTGWSFGYATAGRLVAVAKAGVVLSVAAVLATALDVLGASRRGGWRWRFEWPWKPGRRPVHGAHLRAALALLAAGGLSSLLLLIPGLSSSLAGTYFETGCRHLVLGAAVLALYFDGLHRAWPVLAGREASEKDARRVAAAIVAGSLLTFLPQLVLGWQGLPRRYHDYPPEFQPLQVVAGIGAVLLVAGCLLEPLYLLRSALFRTRPDDSPEPR